MRNAPEKSEAFLRWGDSKKVRFVLRGRTLRCIFSERFVLRIIQDGSLLDTIAVFKHICLLNSYALSCLQQGHFTRGGQSCVDSEETGLCGLKPEECCEEDKK